MGVYRPKDRKVYWISYFDCEGKRRYESAKSTKKKVAEALWVKRKNSVNEGTWDEQQIKASPKFSAFADEYLENYSKQNKKPSTHKRDKGLMQNLSEFFGGRKLKDINPMFILSYRKKRLEEDGRKPATVNREVALLKSMFTVAIEWGKAYRNPVKRVKKLREDNEIANPIPDDDEELLLEHAAQHLGDLIICGADTGMRKGEMFDLKWESVDLVRRVIRVDKTKNDRCKIIPITDRLLSVLERLRKESTGKYVFSAPNIGHRKKNPREKLTSVDTAWRRANERAGLAHKRYRFHDLRGTFITRLVEEGKNLVQIKQLSGHSTTRMLERYARPGEESGRDCIASLDRRRDRKTVIDFEEHSG